MKNRIREHRLARGWSQEDLAARVGTTNQQISRLENSRRGLDTKWLRLIAVAFGITQGELLIESTGRPKVPVPDSSQPGLDDVELALLDMWRELPEEVQDWVIGLIDNWRNQR